MTVRTRFAPSPTGYLHIGGVRTALFNWLLAKQAGGQFILRIDDTDLQRNQAEALQPILDGFRWLGIDWDEGPTPDGTGSIGPHGSYFQSQRLEHYQAAAQKLLQSGHAYRDYATTEEIAVERAQAESNKTEFVYSRRWMAGTDADAQTFESEGRSAVVRMKMPREGVCRIEDLIRGPVEFDWAREQDHVIQRADGTCLYHLASVVDDHDFEITHVVRAVEHLSNTPRQMFIAQSLGYELPKYAHIPFVAEPGSKTKLSKRKIEKYLKNNDFKSLVDRGMGIANRIGIQATPETFNPVLVAFYRDTGFLPDAVMNYLLLLGWSLDDKTEEFSREEMIRAFTLDRVVKSEASYDPPKLMSFQQRYMNALSEKQKVALALPFLQKAGLVASPPPCDVSDKLRAVIQAAGDRLTIAGDILQFDEFFVNDGAMVWDEAAFQKKIAGVEGVDELLSGVSAALENVQPYTAANIEARIKSFCEGRGIKIGQLMAPLRIAATGKQTGVGMFDALEILGAARTQIRIQGAIERISTFAERKAT